MVANTQRKCVIVTGGSSGIGAATALIFAKHNYDIVINYSSNADGAEEVAQQCRAHGVNVEIVRGNIAKDEDCRSIAAIAIEKYGRIDVLVNNAGVTRYADATDLEASGAQDFEHIFSVNVTGTYQMIRAAAPHLRKSSAGAIVNVSSDSAFSGAGSSLAYAASKGALNTMTMGLAKSLAPEIRVNAICPGFVDTTWALAWQSEETYAMFKTRLRAIAPLNSIPQADDIADAVFWFGDNARCITGQLLVIDSGSHLTAGDFMAPLL